MSAAARRWLWTGVRIAICAAALIFVIRGVTLDDEVGLANGTRIKGTLTSSDPVVIRLADGTSRPIAREEIAVDKDGALKLSYGLRSSWHAGRKDLLLLALVVQIPVPFLLGLRLRSMLGVQEIHLSFWDCVKLSFAGNFLNFATPLGSNAGDVFKAYFVSLHTVRKTEAATTIALDRVLGLGTLVVVVAVIALLSAPDSRLAQFKSYTLTMLAIGVVGLAVYLSPWFHRWFIARRFSERFSVFRHVQRIDAAARALAARPGTVMLCGLMTLALQFTAIASYFVVAVAFGLEAHAGNAMEYYAYFATGAVVQALPGPPQGLGTVELTYRYFFASFGSASQILCVAFFVRVVVLLVALPGALVALTGSYRPRKDSVGEANSDRSDAPSTAHPR